MTEHTAPVVPLRPVEDCPRCEIWAQTCEQIKAAEDQARADRKSAERHVRTLNRRLAALEEELSGVRQQSPHFDDAQTIFEFWKLKVRPGARSFTGERLKNTLAVLKAGEFDGLYICEAIVGMAREPYQKGDRKFDDLAMLTRDPKHLEHFHDVFTRTGGVCRCEAAPLPEPPEAVEGAQEARGDVLTGSVEPTGGVAPQMELGA